MNTNHTPAQAQKLDKKENLTTPGKPMTQKKFSAMIKEAENGGFMEEGDFVNKFE
jgi:hypothetical protein